MVQFHARQDATGAKYNVPSGEQYYCFSFHKDWGGTAQGLALGRRRGRDRNGAAWLALSRLFGHRAIVAFAVCFV